MYFSEEVNYLVDLDSEHREKWLSATGLLVGLEEEEKKIALSFFDIILNDWEHFKKYEQIYEFFPPMIRRAVNFLYTKNDMIWSVQRDDRRLFVFRNKFNIYDFVDHFNRIFTDFKDQFQTKFVYLDSDAELCHLSIRDYFYKLAEESKTEDYLQIKRDIQIKNLIDEN